MENDPYLLHPISENAVDIHSHVIFDVDDGASSIEESLHLLRLDYAEGVRAVFATPHYGKENGYAPSPDKVRSNFEELSARVCDEMPDMTLYLGTEWYCSKNIVSRIRYQRGYRMNDTDNVLVEFLEYGDVSESSDEIITRLKQFSGSGLRPILAHAERYQNLQRNYDSYKKLQDIGVLFQVNAYDLFLNKNEITKDAAQWLAKNRMISFIGSDMHGLLPKRPPRVREGIDWLYNNTDPDYANAVIRKNAENILNVRPLKPWHTDDYFMTPETLAILQKHLKGIIVRWHVFPANESISCCSFELDDGRSYMVIEGFMGPRLFLTEGFVDESNSRYVSTDLSFYWKWNTTGNNIRMKCLGGLNTWPLDDE